MNKKAIAILGAIFLLIAGTLGFLIYSKTSSKKTTTPPAGNLATSSPDTSVTPTPTPSPTSISSGGGAVQLTTDQVISPTLFYNGNGVDYFNQQGELYQAALDSSSGSLQLSGKKKLSIESKSNLIKVLWPQKTDNFVEQQSLSGQPVWSIYNSQSGSFVDLPSQVTAIDWLPSGDHVMMIWLDKNVASLYTSDVTGKDYKYVGKMWEQDDAINVSPDGQTVAYYETANSAADNPINAVSVDGKVWKTFVKDGQNFGVLWSPDSQKLLFAKKDPNTQKFQLWVYSVLDDKAKNLGLYSTVDKAVWAKDSQTLYVAVPKAGSATDTSLSSDDFIKIDTTTLAQKTFTTGSSAIDGRDLFINVTGDKLFFRNAQDGTLYYIDLTK